MKAKPSNRQKYRDPSIVFLGSVNELTRGHSGDICDGTPCNSGLYRPYTPAEKGKKISDIPVDHKHDPKYPLTPPKK